MLALEDLRPSDVQAIRGAVVEVRGRCATGDLRWYDEDASTLRLIDGGLRMFDDPEFGRPIWPPPLKRDSPRPR